MGSGSSVTEFSSGDGLDCYLGAASHCGVRMVQDTSKAQEPKIIEVLEVLLGAWVLSQMSDDGAPPDLEEVEEAEAAAAAEAGEDGDEGEEGEAARAPRLVVSGEIYEGTVVGSGSLALVVDCRIDHCTLRESEGRIQVFPL